MHRTLMFLLTGFLAVSAASAQTIPLNRYGLPVVRDPALYRQLVQRDTAQRMVDLERFIPGIRLQVYYATDHNFTHRRLYRHPKAFLRIGAARALKSVAEDMRKKGLGLLIFDAYRPYRVTEKMWQVAPDNRYAADPRHGSGHNRGIAVDVTLYDLKTGKPLDMPTGFDNFTARAHRDFMALPGAEIANRQLLQDVMVHYGFVPLSTEWWHFSLKDGSRYPLMDLPFRDLEKPEKTNLNTVSGHQ